MQLLTVVRILIRSSFPAKLRLQFSKFTKSELLYRYFLQISTSGGGETATLRNSLLLIYIKRAVLTRGLFSGTVFKSTILCSVTLIMFLFCYKDKNLIFFYIQRILTRKYFAAIRVGGRGFQLGGPKYHRKRHSQTPSTTHNV